jgi:hypothetical protein
MFLAAAPASQPGPGVLLSGHVCWGLVESGWLGIQCVQRGNNVARTVKSHGVKNNWSI